MKVLWKSAERYTRMRVTICLHHINAGKRGHPKRCPIALALMEKTNSCHVAVEKKFIKIDNVFYRVSKRALEFINNFDYNRGVDAPITFNFRKDEKGKGYES